MAFCSKCGAALQTGARFCAACGAATGATNDFHNFINTPDSTAQFDPRDIEDNKYLALLSYLGLLALIPYFAVRTSPYVRYHAVQGMYFLVACVALSALSSLMFVLFWIVPFIPGVVSFALWAGMIALMAIGIVNAAVGRARELPLVGKMQKLGWFR